MKKTKQNKKQAASQLNMYFHFYLSISNYNIPLLDVEQQICLLVQHRSYISGSYWWIIHLIPLAIACLKQSITHFHISPSISTIRKLLLWLDKRLRVVQEGTPLHSSSSVRHSSWSLSAPEQHTTHKSVALHETETCRAASQDTRST